jgi:phenylacetate-CoA ligase
MAIATVVEETAGVRRYQVVQTANDTLTVRLENNPGTDPMRSGNGSARV